MAKTIIFKGNLIKCNRTSKEYKGVKGKEKLYITLADVKLSKEQEATIKEAFKEAGKKFTPKWVSEFEGYVNLSTLYKMPYKNILTNEDGQDFEAYIEEGFLWLGSLVEISVNVKEGALYPKAIRVLEEGKEYDPFDDFEE